MLYGAGTIKSFDLLCNHLAHFCVFEILTRYLYKHSTAAIITNSSRVCVVFVLINKYEYFRKVSKWCKLINKNMKIYNRALKSKLYYKQKEWALDFLYCCIVSLVMWSSFKLSLQLHSSFLTSGLISQTKSNHHTHAEMPF